MSRYSRTDCTRHVQKDFNERRWAWKSALWKPNFTYWSTLISIRTFDICCPISLKFGISICTYKFCENGSGRTALFLWCRPTRNSDASRVTTLTFCKQRTPRQRYVCNMAQLLVLTLNSRRKTLNLIDAKCISRNVVWREISNWFSWNLGPVTGYST